jgi:hypothetical protein
MNSRPSMVILFDFIVLSVHNCNIKNIEHVHVQNIEVTFSVEL